MYKQKAGDNMSSKNNIGDTLKNLRGNKTQIEVANALGITKSSWSMYERNERIPRDEIKIKIANYFEKSVQELFFMPMEEELLLQTT